jgi:hypothetical protein
MEMLSRKRLEYEEASKLKQVHTTKSTIAGTATVQISLILVSPESTPGLDNSFKFLVLNMW